MNQREATFRSTSSVPQTKTRLYSCEDLRVASLAAVFRLMLANSPTSAWMNAAGWFARVEKGTRSSGFGRFAKRVRGVFGTNMHDAEIVQLWRNRTNALMRQRISVLASRYSPHWQPKMELVGREHLDRSIEAGHGTVLWLDNFMHHSVVGKRAFAEAGYLAWQASSTDHGFSTSRLGRYLLNPIQIEAEKPYILGRLVFDNTSALAAMRHIDSSMRRNEIVRITNNAHIGRQRVWVPIGSTAILPIATTPFNIARRTGAAVLLVCVIEREPFADYLVTISPNTSGDIRLSREEDFKRQADAYIRYLAPLAAQYPAQWNGWGGVAIERSIDLTTSSPTRTSAGWEIRQ